jgi:hypothetical protein
MKMRTALLMSLPLLLAGCLDDTASLRLDGNDHALTLQARQPYFWRRTVELEVVMSRLPDCSRRSRLEPATLEDLVVEVYRPEPGEYVEPILILKQGARHYAIGTANCEMQKFKTPPARPGTRLGTFRREGDKRLKFVPAPAAPAAASANRLPAQQR